MHFNQPKPTTARAVSPAEAKRIAVTSLQPSVSRPSTMSTILNKGKRSSIVEISVSRSFISFLA